MSFLAPKYPIINEAGDWRTVEPQYEPQAENYETCGCPIWAGQNVLEMLTKYHFGVEPNYSERYNCALLGIRCPGITPEQADDSLCRKHGVIPASLLPVPATHPEFMDATVITHEMKEVGTQWLCENKFRSKVLWSGEISFGERIALMREWLKRSPLAIGVSSWYEQNGVYVDNWQPNNHRCVATFLDDQGIHVFDTYDHSRKILALDHNIQHCTAYSLKRKHTGSIARMMNLGGIL